jgi:hypothetical protein
LEATAERGTTGRILSPVRLGQIAAAARKRVARAEVAGGFKLRRSAPFGRKP